jgi:hypothetical protein
MRIRPPAPGRTTALLVEYKYSPTHKRTMPVRLGSFNVKTDPDALPTGIKLHGGRTVDFATIQSIREFLLANRPARFSAELVAQCRADIEAEVRAEVEAERQHHLEVRDQDPLDLVESTLAGAATELIRRAEQLRADGHKLTSQRSQATSAPADANPLDALQARANCIRRDLFERFEAACKEAGLMVKKSGAQ